MPTALRAYRVLICDDNVDAATILGELLIDLGHEVRVVHHAAAALVMLDTFEADAGLFDIDMPEMDGYELARRVRAGGRTEMFLVAITGFGRPSDRQSALDAGFDEHIAKPAPIEKVLNALARSR